MVLLVLFLEFLEFVLPLSECFEFVYAGFHLRLYSLCLSELRCDYGLLLLHYLRLRSPLRLHKFHLSVEGLVLCFYRGCELFVGVLQGLGLRVDNTEFLSEPCKPFYYVLNVCDEFPYGYHH